MILQHTMIFSPPLPLPACYYWKAAVTWKVRWEIIECWWFFSSSAHFFQWNSTFSANAPHMISQPIDQFLPTQLLLPTRIHYNRATTQKEWCETVLFFWSLSHFTHFFSIQLLILGRMRHSTQFLLLYFANYSQQKGLSCDILINVCFCLNFSQVRSNLH